MEFGVSSLGFRFCVHARELGVKTLDALGASFIPATHCFFMCTFVYIIRRFPEKFW